MAAVIVQSVEGGSNNMLISDSATNEISLDQLGISDTSSVTTPAVNPLDDKELQKKSLQIFRDLISGTTLSEHQKKDEMLMRWLTACNLDPMKAQQMLQDDLKWRQDNDMGKIISWEHPTHLTTDFPFQLCGLDKDGDLFGLITWSKMDVNGAVAAIMEGRVHAEYLRYLWKCLEIVHKIYEANSTPERTVTKGTIIVDLEGFSMYQFASPKVIEIVLEVVRRYEASYPNMLKAAIVVNTPIVFNVLWNAMKPFLSEYTLSRVQIYGSGWIGQDWKSVLRNSFPINKLPSSVGGANTTVKNYDIKDGYVNLQPPCISEFPPINMVCATIPAGQKLTLDFKIVTPGSKLSWGFKTDYYDIGFSVVNEANEEVVASFRVDAHMNQQKGFVICNTSQTYSLVFDNTFSQYRSKTLYHTVKVLPPISA